MGLFFREHFFASEKTIPEHQSAQTMPSHLKPKEVFSSNSRKLSRLSAPYRIDALAPTPDYVPWRQPFLKNRPLRAFSKGRHCASLTKTRLPAPVGTGHDERRASRLETIDSSRRNIQRVLQPSRGRANMFRDDNQAITLSVAARLPGWGGHRAR